ncbi:thioredoxin [Stieleria sp. JC731]|uniref:thioredoxin n=1 Tax=Pirellulaceae TaxID=2691357 RepID=UPI001E636273|nr:thioredoxin [Stieleria sp. JC731]MCC9604088.1 thioredoxin [Stieleria sp. JC731]
MRRQAFAKFLLLALCVVVTFGGCGSRPAGPSLVKSIDEADFQSSVLDSDKVVLVDFWATWCGPCQQQGPIVDELAESLSGSYGFAKVDIDLNPNLAYEYGIEALPTLAVFKNGKMVNQLVGLHDAAELRDALEKASRK